MNKQKLLLWIICGLFSVDIKSQQSFENGVDSTIHLNEVMVNAYQINTLQHQIPGSISVLSGEEIQKADGNNFANTLHSMPGIYMHSGTYATSRIVIRGVGSRTPYNTNRIKSYLNDIPISSSDGISSPEDIDLTGIGRIEVIKGPASALYGSGLGGNIHLFTPVSTHQGVDALLQFESFNTLKVAAAGNYHQENFTLFGNLAHLESDGFRENNQYKRSSLLSSGMWRQPNFSLEYTLLLMDIYAQIPSSIGKTLYETNPKAAAESWKAVNGFKEYQRAIAGVTLANRFAEQWNNRLTLFGRWTDSYELRPFNNLDDGTSGGGIRNKLTFHASHWDALLGVEWITDYYRWQLDLDGELINKNSERRDDINLSGMIYWRPSPLWNISLGGAVNKIHYELTDQFSDNGDQSGKRNFPSIFSPRMGINYAPSSRFALYFSIGKGFSMPSPEETLMPEGDINEALKPEQGVQYETGIRWNLFGNATHLEASIYLIDLNNLLVTKRLTEDIFTGINAGKTRHAGVELLLKQRIFQLPSFPGKLQLNANYTFSHNQFIDFTDDGQTYDGNILPGIPSHIAQADFRWEPVAPLNLDAQFQYVGSQYIDDANSLENDAYFLTNLRTSYRIKTNRMGDFKLFAGINNVADIHYSPMLTVNAVAFGDAEPRYYYPGMPRHYFAGISWHF
ncbi:MAG TPA: TonB-dependent receptor [Dysgonamonadaceae bacterium]|nr:TonB-dependent receptor [Dysgonamonadaceae bacterium]HOV35725.1 TonB-dependent receptor [Dysgonamonadaceae bacterium]HRS41209.1 TonB-dependent receptor [Dysgonamonadaceae bacterium]